MTLITAALSSPTARTHGAPRTGDAFAGLTPSEGEGEALPGDFEALIGGLAGKPGRKTKPGDAGEAEVSSAHIDPAATPPINEAALIVGTIPPTIAPLDIMAGTQTAEVPLVDASAEAIGQRGMDALAAPKDGRTTPTKVLSDDFTQVARRALDDAHLNSPDRSGEAKTEVMPAPSGLQEAAAAAIAMIEDGAPRKVASARPEGGQASGKSASADVPVGTAITPNTAAATDGGDAGRDSQGSGEKSERRLAASAPSPAGQSLRDIVQSLPPIVQTQIGLSGAVTSATVQPANTAQALDAQVIDMGVSGQWIDRMAHEISTLAQGTGQSRFTLMPPHLGRIEISLKQSEASMAVHFATETDEAADRIRAAQTHLQADARLSALSIGTITIEKSQQSFDQATRDGNAWAGSARQSTDGGMQGGAQSQSGGQSGLGRENAKAAGRQAVNHLSETPEQARREGATANPGVRFA